MSDTNTTPTPADTPLRAASTLSFGEKAQLFFKKSQYKNGKGMSDTEAENAARADMGIAALSADEATAATDQNLIQKVVDSKALQAVGASALIHKEWDTVMGNKTEEKIETPTVDIQEAAAEDSKVAAEVTPPAESQSFKEQAINKVHSFEETAKEKATAAAQGVIAAAAAKVGLETHTIDTDATKTEVFDRVPEEGSAEQ